MSLNNLQADQSAETHHCLPREYSINGQVISLSKHTVKCKAIKRGMKRTKANDYKFYVNTEISNSSQ